MGLRKFRVGVSLDRKCRKEKLGEVKAMHIIPPVVALVAVVVWNISQRDSVSDEEEHGRELRERISGTRSAENERRPGAGERRASAGGSMVGGSEMDWADFSNRMIEAEGSSRVEDLEELMEMNERVAKMTAEEIIAALDEVASLELEDEARVSMEELLVESLIEADPEAALMKFADRIHMEDDEVGWQMSFAFGAWAGEDTAAAVAWFDRQISEGLFESKTLDGQSEARMDFESELVGILLATDLDAAGGRIAALPEDQRRDVLEMIYFEELPEQAQQGYAKLVRGLVPEDERAGAFTNVASALVSEDGFEGVGKFLDSVNATAAERVVSSREAANSLMLEIADERVITRSDVETMRKWLEGQAPGTADKVTGEALGDAAQDGGEFGFAAASELALEYHRSSGNDDVLVAFLESYAAQSNLEQALPLADNITDAKRREDLLRRLK